MLPGELCFVCHGGRGRGLEVGTCPKIKVLTANLLCIADIVNSMILRQLETVAIINIGSWLISYSQGKTAIAGGGCYHWTTPPQLSMMCLDSVAEQFCTNKTGTVSLELVYRKEKESVSETVSASEDCPWVAETVCCTTMAMLTISRMWIWVLSLTKDEVRHPVALSSMLVPSHEAVLSHTWSRLISMLHILTRPFKFIYIYSFLAMFNISP